MSAPFEQLTRNPFFVLELPVTATAAEIDRQGQKLIGLFALGVASAATYKTPWSREPRTEEDVRAAMSQLRHPDARAVFELWATP